MDSASDAAAAAAERTAQTHAAIRPHMVGPERIFRILSESGFRTDQSGGEVSAESLGAAHRRRQKARIPQEEG